MSSTQLSCAQWFAVSVRPNHESVVKTMLEHKEYEVFLPLYRRRRMWSDRIKESSSPLFPGYIFCRFNPSVISAPVVTTPGVIKVIGVGPTPVAVDDAEIDAIQKAVAAGFTVSPWPKFQPGSAVSIMSGPLAGVRGTVVRIKSQDELILSISLLQRSVVVHIDSALCVKDLAA